MQLVEGIINLFDFIGGLVCHQLKERTFWVGGHYLPVCARDTGAFIGLWLGYTLVAVLCRRSVRGPPNLYLSFALMFPLWVDSLGQIFGFWTSTNELRLITGLLFGTVLSPWLIYVLSLPAFRVSIPLMRNVQPEVAILDEKNSWFGAKALLLGIFCSLILFSLLNLLVGSEFPLFYWMLSIPIVAGIVLHFIVLPLVLLIVVLNKYLARVDRRRRQKHRSDSKQSALEKG